MAPPRSQRPAPRRSGTANARPGRRLLSHDRKLGARVVAGADEAGRGCLAGPLVTAAVAFDYATLMGPDAAPLGHLNDSKKLTLDVRERLYDAVLSLARSWSVVVISPGTIDRRGLHKSNVRGLGLALERLQCPVELGLTDGFHVECAGMTTQRIIKGDATSAAIAAASILAKVTRDRLMHRLDQMLDGRWAFAEHVGYATPLHHERIREHGMSEHHRRSFDSVAYRDLAPAVGNVRSEGVSQVVDPFDATTRILPHEEHVEAVAPNAPV